MDEDDLAEQYGRGVPDTAGDLLSENCDDDDEEEGSQSLLISSGRSRFDVNYSIHSKMVMAAAQQQSSNRRKMTLVNRIL